MKRLPMKYLAGLIDGEGCIDVMVGHGKYIRPRLRLALTENSKFVLDMIQNTFGGNLYYREYNNEVWSNSYSWEITSYKNVCVLLRNLINFLYIKKEQAKFMLELEKIVRGKALSCDALKTIKQELSLMKKDPHRLSEKAVENLLQVL